MIEPARVAEQARQWVGVRFLHQGRTRFGCDCLGFIAAMLAELGSPTFLDYLPLNYARDPQSVLIDGLGALTREIPTQPGALLLIQWPLTAHPSHAAILTDSGSMIHSYQMEGKVVEHGYREPWVHRTVSTWALPLVRYQ